MFIESEYVLFVYLYSLFYYLFKQLFVKHCFLQPFWFEVFTFLKYCQFYKIKVTIMKIGMETFLKPSLDG